jgi:hypothetical protein
MNDKVDRRPFLKAVGVGAVVTLVPKSWMKPIVHAVIVPAHAAASPATTTATSTSATSTSATTTASTTTHSPFNNATALTPHNMFGQIRQDLGTDIALLGPAALAIRTPNS